MKLNFTRKKWQSLLFLLFFFGISSQMSAQTTYYARVTGAWNVSTTWSTVSGSSPINTGTFPGNLDTAIIGPSKTVTINNAASPTFASQSALCNVVNVIGGNAKLDIGGSSTLTCNTINVNTAGRITFISNPNVATACEIICSGDVSLGTTANTNIGYLNMELASKITCNKLKIAKTTGGAINGVIVNRSLVTKDCTFIFKGFGSDVVPELTLLETEAVPDFYRITLDPGANNTVTLPPNFSAAKLTIDSGIIDTSNNYNYAYNVLPGGLVNTTLNMASNTTLRVGGALGMPNFKNYELSPNATTEFYGSQQTIKGIGEGYQKLKISGGTITNRAVKSVEGGSLLVYVDMQVADYTTLDLAGNGLVLYCQYLDNTSGNIKSTGASSITYNAGVGCSMRFDDSVPGVTNVIKDFKIGDDSDPQENIPTLLQPLDIEIKNALNIEGTVKFYGGHLISNGNVTFKSNEATTAFVGPIPDKFYDGTSTRTCGIIGDVKVERFIPATRAFRPLASSVTGGTIFSNWQENGSVANVEGSILGNTLTTTTTPTTPLLGKRISGTNIQANVFVTDDSNAASGVYTISMPVQNLTSRTMIARNASGVTVAMFTGVINSNVLTPTAFTVGSLATLQNNIPNISLNNTLINTVIIADNLNGTFTIGQKLPSQTIHFNGALPGFGTHVTGIAGLDSQLGQNDSNTGLDITRSGNPSLFTYGNNTNVFATVSNTKTESMVAGKPYFMLIRGDRAVDLAINSTTATNTTLRSSGTIVEGPVTVEGLSLTENFFNFVGNPYQAPVDLSAMYSGGRMTNLGTSYTVFDTKVNTRGAYATYDFDLGSSTVEGDDPLEPQYSSLMNNTLEPNQAFFVTTTGPTPTLIFNEADKIVDDNAYVPMFRTAQSTTPIIKGSICNASTNKTLDGFIIAFSDTFNNSIIAEDSRKPTGNQDETFASKNGTVKMGIDKINVPTNNDEIPLSITQYRLTNYKLKFKVSNFNQMDAFLIDNFTNTETLLNNNQTNSYSFTVNTTIPASIAENRFKIVFRTAALNTNVNSLSQFAVYPNPVIDDTFTIKMSKDYSGKTANVNISNYLGQKVYSYTGAFLNDGSLLVNPTTSISKGVYVLKVEVEGKVETKKLIIK